MAVKLACQRAGQFRRKLVPCPCCSREGTDERHQRVPAQCRQNLSGSQDSPASGWAVNRYMRRYVGFDPIERSKRNSSRLTHVQAPLFYPLHARDRWSWRNDLLIPLGGSEAPAPVPVVGADAHTRPYHADNRTGLAALLTGESLARGRLNVRWLRSTEPVGGWYSCSGIAGRSGASWG